MRPITVQVGPLAAASANNIATTQSVTAGNSVIINGSTASGGVAILDKARRVLITSAGNDSGMFFTIKGTDNAGATITENLVGGNASAVYSVLDYLTVTSITPSASTAAAVTVGTNGIASSPWIRLDEWANAQTALQAVVTGTVNYTVQQTLDDPNNQSNPITPDKVQWFSTSDAAMVNATASAQSNYGFSPIFCRVTLNSGSGSVRFTASQFSAVPL